MKLVTWNVNGLRSYRGGSPALLAMLGADLVCIQETKLTRDVLTADSTLANVNGFNSYFAFTTALRKGYSGVATFCADKAKPIAAGDRLSMEEKVGTSEEACSPLHDFEVDNEGRAVITEFRAQIGDSEPFTVCLVNVYCPRWDVENLIRLEFKMRFHRLLEARIHRELGAGKHVILVGDLNVAHRRVDHCEHHLIENFDQLPHRLWLDALIAGDAPILTDLFRRFYPDEKKAYTCWNQLINARASNYGTRIDFILADPALVEMGVFADCRHLTTVLGSDHCPVIAEFSAGFELLGASQLPALCCRLMPEIRGTQTSIRTFFSASAIRAPSPPGKRRKLNTGAKQASISAYFCKQYSTGPSMASASAALIIDESIDTDQDAAEVQAVQPTGENAAAQSAVQVQAVQAFNENQSATQHRAGRPVDENGAAQPVAQVQAVSKPIDALSRLLNGGPPRAASVVPLCSGHGEPCQPRLVKKRGPNLRRRFFACARPPGVAGDAQGRCNFFQWADGGT